MIEYVILAGLRKSHALDFIVLGVCVALATTAA